MMGMFDADEYNVDEMSALALSAGWKIVEMMQSLRLIWAYATVVPV